MILHHYTQRPFTFSSERTYAPGTLEPYFKPVGLWLSDCEAGRGWKEWCEYQSWNLEGIKHRTSFQCDISEWKVLRSTEDLFMFTDEYHVQSTPDESILSTIAREYIDWPRVMKEFPGILISPYNYTCRIKLMWYYGWDCASACVWDLSTIKVLEEREVS